MKRSPVAMIALASFAALAGLACETLGPQPPPHVEALPPAPAKTDAPVAPTPTASTAPAPTIDDARAFVAGVDTDLRKLWVASQRAAWVAENFITDDTAAISSAAEEASMEYLSRTIKASTRFEGLSLPPDVARQIHLLKLESQLPAPSDAAERAELAAITVGMSGMYGKGG